MIQNISPVSYEVKEESNQRKHGLLLILLPITSILINILMLTLAPDGEDGILIGIYAMLALLPAFIALLVMIITFFVTSRVQKFFWSVGKGFIFLSLLPCMLFIYGVAIFFVDKIKNLI